MLRRVVDLWEGWIVYLLLPALTLLVAADVALRYGFNTPLRWGSDVKELMLLLVVTAGLPATSLAGQHIRVSLFENRLDARVRLQAARVRHALTGLVASAVTYATYSLMLDVYRYGDRAEMIAIPFAPIAALVTVSAALSALAEFARAVHPLTEGE
jgi:TRAP-type C4-dicarboxylate transport system permease small subunit